MNSIPTYSRPPAGYGNGNGSMGQTGLRTFEQSSVTASRSQNLDLALKTREGDLVTINAASFAELDAFAYDQTGKLTHGGTVSTSRSSSRSMTLATGSRFTFSVNGDLSDPELDDIEQIVASLDRVLEKMASGDMDGAVEAALAMTGYDTVSSFSADLSMERSYTLATAVGQEHYTGSQGSAPVMPSPGSSQNGILVESLKALMDEAHENIQKMSQQPIDQLFAEYLKAFDRTAHESGHGPDRDGVRAYGMMADLRQQLQLL